MKRKFLSGLLALSMVLTLLPATAWADVLNANNVKDVQAAPLVDQNNLDNAENKIVTSYNVTGSSAEEKESDTGKYWEVSVAVSGTNLKAHKGQAGGTTPRHWVGISIPDRETDLGTAKYYTGVGPYKPEYTTSNGLYSTRATENNERITLYFDVNQGGTKQEDAFFLAEYTNEEVVTKIAYNLNFSNVTIVPLQEIETVAVTLNTAGLKVNDDLPNATTSTDGAKVTTVWKDASNNAVTKVEAADTYTATISVTADTGYKLADSVAYTLNGGNSTTLSDGSFTTTATVADDGGKEISAVAVTLTTTGLTTATNPLPQATTSTQNVILTTVWKNEDGDTVDAFAAAGTYTAEITVAADAAEGYSLASGVTYTLNGTDATLEDGVLKATATVTAPVVQEPKNAPEAKPAHLADRSGSIPDANIVGTYTAVVENTSIDDDVATIAVKVTAENLRKHVRSQESATDGYWMGLALVAPEGAEKVKYQSSESEITVLSWDGTLTEFEPNVVHDGTGNGIALYVNKGDTEESVKKHLAVQWLDGSDNAIALKADGETTATTFIYNITWVAETVPDVEVKPAAPSGGSTVTDPEKATEASNAFDAIKAGTNVVTTGVLTGAVEAMPSADYAKAAKEPTQAEVSSLKTTLNTEENITTVIVIQPYLDITVTDIDVTDTTEKYIEVDITPMYRVVLTKSGEENNIKLDAAEANAILLEGSGRTGDLTLGSTEVKLPIPNALATAATDSTLYVVHDGSTEYTGTVSGATGSYIVTFTTDGFSPFKISTRSQAVATTDDPAGSYTSLQAAVDAVANGGKITLSQPVDLTENITISAAKAFTIDTAGKDLTMNSDPVTRDNFVVGSGLKVDSYDDTSTANEIAITVDNVTMYTVTFNSQGGSAVSTQSVAEGGKATQPTAPTRSGYTFGGWYKEADCTTAWDFATDTVNANTTLYAKWTQNSNSGNRPSGGGSSSGGGGGASTSASTITISSDDNSVKADVKISGSTATISKPDKLDKVIGDGVVSIDLSKEKKDIDTVKVDSAIVNAIANDEDSEGMEIKLSDGTVILDADAVAAVKDGDLTVKLDKANGLNSKQKDAVKGMDVHANYELTVNGTKALKDGKVEVRLPFAVPSDKDADGFGLYFVAEDGTAEAVFARFSGSEVRFTAAAFGDYVIAYKEAAPVDNTPVENKPVTADCDGGSDCPAHKFTDVNTSLWYHKAVDYAITNGLMSGVGDSTFSPNANLSRAMLAQILYNLAGRPAVTGNSDFNDVAAGMWYTNAVAWATENGVVSGYGNGQFGPNDNITREQLAVMLYRYAGSPAANGSLSSFADAGRVSGYAQNALVWATTNGVMSGKGGGALDPQGMATRAEVAQMLYNYMGR